jgi:hypothetical protein
MAKTFKTKVRKVGTSFGVLIPKDVVDRENIREGEEVTVGLLKVRKVEDVLKLFGSAGHAKSFRRDRKDRLERY